MGVRGCLGQGAGVERRFRVVFDHQLAGLGRFSTDEQLDQPRETPDAAEGQIGPGGHRPALQPDHPRVVKLPTSKRELAARYAAHLAGSELQFVTEPAECRSNYWLNAVVCDSREQRDHLLKSTNDAGVMTRPIWALMNRLPAYAHCRQGPLTQAEWLEARVVNLPSSVLPQ